MPKNLENRDSQIKCLQQNLAAIRKIAGWTAEQLADKIGVTKQTISNLETGKTPLNLTQYIAIRAIVDYEIETNKENTVLPQVVTILLDKCNELNEEDYNKVKEAINVVSISAAGGVTGATLASVFMGLLSGIPSAALIGAGIALGPIGVIGGAVTGSWLKKILKKNEQKKDK
ncbi:helix-turn-helix transcriptional regulator [Phosphitispora fastidiosa]|uniref:helix-turn-helix transcriptional regulator n=1 Tax=Phosphitispora fastidiosa TaxID=2837202 RepID=UPI001E403D2A|nr:helix-turn-helix transcriptional regulator [Phosphitispora fastidiosa]MBU7006191.1 transcriptional regulator with XRE-family HTH domain [Phosphitispora fastidiosa]